MAPVGLVDATAYAIQLSELLTTWLTFIYLTLQDILRMSFLLKNFNSIS